MEFCQLVKFTKDLFLYIHSIKGMDWICGLNRPLSEKRKFNKTQIGVDEVRSLKSLINMASEHEIKNVCDISATFH